MRLKVIYNVLCLPKKSRMYCEEIKRRKRSMQHRRHNKRKPKEIYSGGPAFIFQLFRSLVHKKKSKLAFLDSCLSYRVSKEGLSESFFDSTIIPQLAQQLYPSSMTLPQLMRQQIWRFMAHPGLTRGSEVVSSTSLLTWFSPSKNSSR